MSTNSGHFPKWNCKILERAVAVLGGCSWGQLPPLHDENSAWRPLFTEKCALRRYPMTSLFKFCDQNVGQMYKSRRYLVQKLMNFLNQESKNFLALTARFFSIILSAPSFQAAAHSPLRWIRPWERERHSESSEPN